MRPPEKQSNGRIFLIYILLSLFGIACMIQILTLSIRDGGLYSGTDTSRCLDKTKEGWENDPLSQNPDCQCEVVGNTRIPKRGDIYDDQGRILASDLLLYDITIDGRAFALNNKSLKSNPQRLDSLIDAVSNELYMIFKDKFKKEKEYYKKQLEKCYKNKENLQFHRSIVSDEKRWITGSDIAKLRQIPFFNNRHQDNATGLALHSRTIRVNPYGEMGKRVVGMKNFEGEWIGLEAVFDNYLHGRDGSKKDVIVNGIKIPLNEYADPIDGSSVNTTLNLEIQNIVHHELHKALTEQNATWGCAIVMETKTGEIKAISNLTYDSLRKDYYEMQNHAYSQVEPGSTFKLASLLAYLERTSDDTSKSYPILAHSFKYPTRSGKMQNYPKQDEPNRAEASAPPIVVFQRSSNVGISSMIFDRYKNFSDYLSKLDSMWITTQYMTQMGAVKPPYIQRNASDFHTYYNCCFGTAIKMCPIQTLTYYNAVANDGKMIAPLFVKSISRNTDTLVRFNSEVICEQICSPQTIDKAKKYLESVVYGQNGTARSFGRNQSYRFAGKTGTRDIWDGEKYDKRRNSVSFCGYFPAENPKYTCIVFIYDIKKKSSVAVDVFTKIAYNTLNVFNYDLLAEANGKTGEKVIPRFKLTHDSHLETLFEHIGMSYKKEITDYQYVKNESGKIKTINIENGESMPNVVEMLPADAIYELNKVGYKVQVSGKGRVKQQEYHKDKDLVIIKLEL